MNGIKNLSNNHVRKVADYNQADRFISISVSDYA